MENIDLTEDKLLSYIGNTVRHVPCRFNFISGDVPKIEVSEGWVTELDFPRLLNRSSTDATGSRFESAAQRYQTNRKVSVHSDLDEKVTQLSKIMKVITLCGDLPDKQGLFRIQIPYFNLKDGGSLLYFEDDNESLNPDLTKIVNGIRVPSQRAQEAEMVQLSWNGMAIEAKHAVRNSFYHLIVEIDIHHLREAEISVARNTIIDTNDRLADVYNIISEKIRSFLRDSDNDLINSSYHLINFCINEYLKPPKGNLLWIKKNLPMRPEPPFTFHITDDEGGPKYFINGKVVNKYDSSITISGVAIQNKNYIQYDRVFVDYGTFFVLPVCFDSEIRFNELHVIGNSCLFPPQWENIFIIKTKDRLLFNRNHFLFKYIDLNHYHGLVARLDIDDSFGRVSTYFQDTGNRLIVHNLFDITSFIIFTATRLFLSPTYLNYLADAMTILGRLLLPSTKIYIISGGQLISLSAEGCDIASEKEIYKTFEPLSNDWRLDAYA